MNILNKFTMQNLKLNKKRTIVTIIGIMLSTALICAVAGMVTSMQKTLVETIKNSDGNYHVCFEDVPKDQLKYIKENVEVDKYFLSNTLGYAKLEGCQNEDKPYVYVMEYDKTALQNSALKLNEGRMPENSDEIVISQHMIDNGRVNLKIGDTITLDIGTRQLKDGTQLVQANPYLTGAADGDEVVEEEIVNTKTKTYTIVGIIKRPSYLLEDYSAPGYTVISYMENEDNIENANISVLYKKPTNNEEATKQIIKTIKDNTGIELNKRINTDLLRFQGAVSENTLNILYGIAGVVILIIVVSSVFVIRNSFSISVSEKTKQYGMLSSVGATKKQIKKTVLLEGFFIGVIAIPLGVICGIIAIVVLIWIVNYILEDMLNGASFVYSVPILPILLSVVISAITIYLSCIIPARRASKISPIEAIRGNDDIKIKSKKIKTSKLTKKLFGIGGVIASKNLKQSRKKYRTTVISLVVSISIFISLTSFLEYGKKMTGMYYTDLGFNISIYGGTEEVYKEIIKLDNIKNYSYSYVSSAQIDIDKYGTEFGKKLSAENEQSHNEAMESQNIEEYEYVDIINIVLLNNDYFKQFMKEIGLNEKDYKTTAILEDDMMQYNTDNTREIKHSYDVKAGDTINIKLHDEEKQIKITKISDDRPMGYENSYCDGGWIFVSEDYFENKENFYLGSLNIDSSNATALENKLIDLKKENEKYSELQITNFEQYAEQENRMILLVSIFLYGFITVITLIGVTNIFNTISTNMILRSKEFANLKSVGMTTKEFNRMIRLESIMYGAKSLLIGIPIGLLGSYGIYQSFANGIDFGYMLPWKAIIISIIFVFIIVGLTMKYSLNKINKQNIIETIRQDNI